MRSPAALVLAGALLVGAARPAGGPGVTVALDDAAWLDLVRYHTEPPLLEPLSGQETAAELLAHPPLLDLPFRSEALDRLEMLDGDGRRWVLRARGDQDALAATLRDCLAPTSTAWPGQALAALGATARVERRGGEVRLALEPAVGRLPHLLAGCPTPAALAEPPFELRDGALWARPSAGPAAPLIEGIARAPARSAQLAQGAPGQPDSGRSLALGEDLLLLLPADAGAREALGLSTALDAAALRQELVPDLLLAAWWGGRGAPSDRLLGSALSPALPPAAPAQIPQRVLTPLPTDAPRLDLDHASDPLLDGVAARLGVLAQAHGWALGSGGARARLLRWRPPTGDAALALVTLAVDLGLDLEGVDAAALLTADDAQSLEAALALERRWLDSLAAVPLLRAHRWLDLHPQLRGVSATPDGGPSLLDARWSKAP